MLTGFFCLALAAAANGANDVSRAAATLVGGCVSAYRRAMLWTVSWTFAGSLASGFLAVGVARKFAHAVAASPSDLPVAVASILLGASAWIAFSTYRRLPVATTHALLGSLAGVAWFLGGPSAFHRIDLTRGFVLPLVASPFIALFLSALVRRLLPTAVGRNLRALQRAHWLSAGLTAFSRGVNDSAKIWAILIPLAALAGPRSDAFVLVAQIATAAAMLAGSLLGGRRVTESLAFRVNAMAQADSVVANVATASVIISASLLGFPVASSHVVSGAILGVGFVSAPRSVRWKMVLEIVSAWVLTLPAAALFSIALFAALESPARLAILLALLSVIAALLLWRCRHPGLPTQSSLPHRLIVFVCNGNTSRSPMAALICKSLLERMRGAIPESQLARTTIVSKGLTATPGDLWAEPALHSLRRLDFPAAPHAASNLTDEIATQAHLIFCMTGAQATQVSEAFPAAANKILRLHPELDIPNPAGKPQEEYDRVAMLLVDAVRTRMNLILAGA